MRAMILAAGRGERMRPLTDTCPKPLLMVAGKPLIEHHIESLRRAGYRELVINLCHLGEQIRDCLGDGSRLGVRIRYSLEQSALETGGGIRNALDLLTDDPFLVVNGDIWCDLDFASLPPLPAERQAHLLLVANPSHNPSGDFHLDANGAVANQGVHTCTFAGIGIYRRALFLEESNQAFPLAPLLRRAADRGEVSGQLHRGAWSDIGTPQRLADLQSQLAAVG